MTDEIEIGLVPNTNFRYIMWRRHEGRLQQTAVLHNCRNRFEINLAWDGQLDELDKKSLHQCLDDWIRDRELEMK